MSRRATPFVLLGLLFSALPATSHSFENTAIVRTVDLGGSLVHVTTTFAAKSLEQDASVYTIALGEEEVDRTSWLDVKVKGQPDDLKMSIEYDPQSQMNLLDVTLPKALSLNSTITIVLETIQTHATWAWPEAAAQGDGQALKYKTDLLVPSPYKTHVQRTKLKSQSPNIISYTTPKHLDAFIQEGGPVTKSGATVTYGPYHGIPPSTAEDFLTSIQQSVVVHYSYDYPVLEVLKLRRAAEISHWGANLNIQDEISLHNAGPTLKGHFSRLEHQTQSYFKRPAAHVLPSLTLHLPAGIRNMYYYDLIGNVSTSHLRVPPSAKKATRAQYSVFEMKPRYPLMGGWNYSFTLGWDSPLENSASWDSAGGKYTVEIPIMTPIVGAVVNDAEVKVILPEGATDVKFAVPFPTVSNTLSTHITYLDTTGRPALTFKYKNLTDKHALSIYVSYRVPLSAHLKKPIAVAAGFFSLFTFALFARRIDLTISKKGKNVS
ncbi:oligosaccharyl transferase alpha subunit [Guyanagaster necrorhizus]|uniref:Dolichyl-diphosphooligosaccharide--protein glycosyltransferase subunit 1 n=1 Tax=Guyanagaster necrorhizus TaxID=856835 RepID=A0A9P7VXW5_9AGAR|nr:oligosaccharyl transferase alpha subunit [Guyanagaster necrorhizus MCA 3950]KAG7449218.1 oligosaccharyl transferase alpha subunit [Guyanagaster necrorhizus MCA 3950]